MGAYITALIESLTIEQLLEIQRMVDKVNSMTDEEKQRIKEKYTIHNPYWSGRVYERI